MEAAKNAELYVCGQGTGTITIAAYGETPTRDIPVVVIICLVDMEVHVNERYDRELWPVYHR